MPEPRIGGGPRVRGLDKDISRIGLGTAWCTLENTDQCWPVFDAFVERGGTVFDTAPVYGESEAALGGWLGKRGARDGIVIITKGAHGDGGGVSPEDFEAVVDAELGASFEALQTDYIDLYLLHRENARVPVPKLVQKLSALVESERVRAYGISNAHYPRFEEACRYAQESGLVPPVAVSNNLALAASTEAFWLGAVSVDAEGERWHERTQMPLFSWSSTAMGFFTGLFTPEGVRGAEGQKAGGAAGRILEVYGTEENFERLRRAEEMGRRKGGFTAVEVALAWVLGRPFPVVPLVGPQTVEQLHSCVRATSLSLSEDEIRWLERA